MEMTKSDLALVGVITLSALVNLPKTGAFITLGFLSVIPLSFLSQRLEDGWLWLEDGEPKRRLFKFAHGVIQTLGTVVAGVTLVLH